MKNQMKKFSMLCTAFVAASALLTGCSNEENPTAGDAGKDGRVALQINSGIQTRAAGKEWSVGDAIGIYMVKTGGQEISETASNRKYTAQTDGENSVFNPYADSDIIYFPVDGSQVDFFLYYPYGNLSDNTYSIDVSNQTNLPAIDLMTAKVIEKEKTVPAITPIFSHLLAKLELNIQAGEGLTDSDLDGLTVVITNQRTAGSYNVLTETMSLADNQDGVGITMNTVADGTTSQAILLPTTEAGGINPIIAGRQLVFTLAATGESFKWAVPDGKQFAAGAKNIYNITMNRTPLGLSATISDWTPGNGSGEGGSAE